MYVHQCTYLSAVSCHLNEFSIETANKQDKPTAKSVIDEVSV